MPTITDPSTLATPEPRRPEASADECAAVEAAQQRRLAFLFRGWLRDGRVHPLLHLMHVYRSGDER